VDQNFLAYAAENLVFSEFTIFSTPLSERISTKLSKVAVEELTVNDKVSVACINDCADPSVDDGLESRPSGAHPVTGVEEIPVNARKPMNECAWCEVDSHIYILVV
jgi:hypothetical protein